MPHSPLPWRYEIAGGDEVIYASDDTQVHVDTLYYPSGMSTCDAQFIVASVNRVAELEAALHKINTLIDSPARFNAEIQAILDSVIDTSDVKFSK